MGHTENAPSTLVKKLNLEQKKEVAVELVNALERGELFPEDLDPELRNRLVRLLEENKHLG
jgi:antitoxin component of MazEF toxin-antitoxin module